MQRLKRSPTSVTLAVRSVQTALVAVRAGGAQHTPRQVLSTVAGLEVARWAWLRRRRPSLTVVTRGTAVTWQWYTTRLMQSTTVCCQFAAEHVLSAAEYVLYAVNFSRALMSAVNLLQSMYCMLSICCRECTSCLSICCRACTVCCQSAAENVLAVCQFAAEHVLYAVNLL